FHPVYFFFSSRRRHTRFSRDWSSDVCSSDLGARRAEDLAEEIPEEVVEVDPLEAAERIVRGPGVAEAVVARPALGVAEDLIGLGGLLELLLGRRIPRVAVRVVLEGDLAEGALEGLGVRVPLDPQHFVIVPL